MTKSAKPRSTQPSRTGAPPSSVAELRVLLLAIARGESEIALGDKARKALGEMIALQGDPALLSITSLAQRLDINPSTITRLAHNLGYSGFGGLQQVLLQASMTPSGAFYTQQAETALTSGASSSKARAERLCRENQANIDRIVDNFDPAQFDLAVDLINKADRISVHGIRQFHAFSSFLVYGLRMIRSDVHLLDGSALGIAEDLATLGSDDLLISASCAPYSGAVIEAAQAASERRVPVLAITDKANSRLLSASKAAILVSHETSFISNSLTAFIALAECLINDCAAARPKAAKAALKDRDWMISRLGIEL